MGLLDRWNKKQEKEQLAKTDAKTETTPVVEADAKPVKKTATKARATKKVAAETKTEGAAPAVVKMAVAANQVLVRPLVTEKSAVAESNNKYSFVVARNANKIQVKQAVAEVYGVTPIRVNIMNLDGKWVRFGHSMGRRQDVKKAVVTLPKGKSITVHAGV